MVGDRIVSSTRVWTVRLHRSGIWLVYSERSRESSLFTLPWCVPTSNRELKFSISYANQGVAIQSPQRTPIPRFPVVLMVPWSEAGVTFSLSAICRTVESSQIGPIQVKVPGDKVPALSKEWIAPYSCLTASSSDLPISQEMDSRVISHFIGD
jgi:hypothetical protein